MSVDIISVVVPCRNERTHIGTFLESVLRQETGGLDWEIIIADGMSDDGTREVVANCGAGRVVLIDNPAVTVSAGLNAAIQMARGNIIVRMDCHTEYAPNYIQECVRVLRQTGAANVGGPARTRARGFVPSAIAAAYHSWFSTGGARFHDENFEGWVDTVTYGCWLKATLERIGLFDETLVRNQDDELNLRLLRSGGNIWQSPAIVSWYSPRGSLSTLFRQYFQYGFWKIPVIRKHRIPASWRHLVPGLFVVGNFALLLAAFLFPHALTAWVSITAVYLLCSLIAAFAATDGHNRELIPLLPPVFAIYHVSYGLGFLYGMIYWTLAGANPRPLGKTFTAISR